MPAVWQLTGTNQIIATLDITSGGQTLTFDVNDGNAYTVLGGLFRVTGTNNSDLTVAVGSNTIATVAGAQMNAAGTYGLELTDTVAHLSGAAGSNITITPGNAAHAGVLQLFISQASPATLA